MAEIPALDRLQQPNTPDQIGRAVVGWKREGLPSVLCRASDIKGFGSVPQGQLLAVNQIGGVCGELLAGTADSEVTETARQLLKTEDGEAVRIMTVDVPGDAAVPAGLSCGGQATIVVQRADSVPDAFWGALAGRRSVAIATVIGASNRSGRSRAWLDEGAIHGSLGDAKLDQELDQLVPPLLSGAHSTVRLLERAEERLLVEVFVPKPRVVVVGAGDLGHAILAQAGLLGWEAEIAENAEAADRALDWAESSAALVMLSHDPKVDAPIMAAAVARGVKYLGALGSRRTQALRAERLRTLGMAEEDIERIRGPIGLNLGGNEPAEVALAICAEILGCRTGRDGRPLVQSSGPIRSSSEPWRPS